MSGARGQAGHRGGDGLGGRGGHAAGGDHDDGGGGGGGVGVMVRGGGQDAATAHAADGVVAGQAGQLPRVLVPAEGRGVREMTRRAVGRRGRVRGLRVEGGVRGVVRVGVLDRQGVVVGVQRRVG